MVKLLAGRGKNTVERTHSWAWNGEQAASNGPSEIGEKHGERHDHGLDQAGIRVIHLK